MNNHFSDEIERLKPIAPEALPDSLEKTLEAQKFLDDFEKMMERLEPYLPKIVVDDFPKKPEWNEVTYGTRQLIKTGYSAFEDLLVNGMKVRPKQAFLPKALF